MAAATQSPISANAPAMRIGLLGFGHVGAAVAQVLAENAAEIAARAACPIELAAVATRTPAKVAGLVPTACRISANIHSVIDDPAMDVVVELMGGTTVARDAVLRAIANGKHIVTANKALLAEHGDEIFAKAQQAGVIVAYEAAVAVAIPIIKILREALVANRIDMVAGIVNGTSNYILTQMEDRRLPYAQALAEAQKLGYAEADPTLDVDGSDAAHKLTIMAALGFGAPLNFSAVQRHGIANVQGVDMACARELGYRIRLIALAQRTPQGLQLAVQPMLVPAHHLLAQVPGAMNGIVVRGNVGGETFHYGAGAGGRATASAVIADLLDVARQRQAPPAAHVPLTGFQPHAAGQVANNLQTSPQTQPQAPASAHYLRLRVDDVAGVLATISQLLVEQGISVAAMWQAPQHGAHPDVALITHLCDNAALQAVLHNLPLHVHLAQPLVHWRVAPLPRAQ